MKTRTILFLSLLCMTCTLVLLLWWMRARIGTNPYLRTQEEGLLRHRSAYQAWLTARREGDIREPKLAFPVVGQASVPECAGGCQSDSIQISLSPSEEGVAIRWLQDGRLIRVLAAARSPDGQRSAALFLHQNKRLLGMQVSADGRVPLYDVDAWIRYGRLRIGAWVAGSAATKRIVIQPSIVGEKQGGVPIPFWCYWEVGESGQVLSRGLYGS